MRVRFDGRIIYDWLTLRRRKTFRAKVVDLSTSCAVPGCPLLMNFEPYWIALQILSLASALFRYRTTRPSSARVASNEPIFLYSVRNSRFSAYTIQEANPLLVLFISFLRWSFSKTERKQNKPVWKCAKHPNYQCIASLHQYYVCTNI